MFTISYDFARVYEFCEMYEINNPHCSYLKIIFTSSLKCHSSSLSSSEFDAVDRNIGKLLS